ncbi:MAG: beta-phosphoglucomutase [Bacteroidales bacterium]|nr:beta-phosphoglucomutase [Bacteroidales bacterium]
MIEALIFDLDGVIVDTAKFHYIAWKELANSLGFNFTEEDNERLKGVSRMRSLDILLEIGGLEFDTKKKVELATSKNNNYVKLINTLTHKDLLPGVLIFMNAAKTADKKIALGSASKNAKQILKSTNLLNFFDAIVDGNEVSKAKPDPEVFLKAAELLKVNPQNCIVFEDAQAGIEAAKNAKMHVIGVDKKNTLTACDFKIKTFEKTDFFNIISKIDLHN